MLCSGHHTYAELFVQGCSSAISKCPALPVEDNLFPCYPLCPKRIEANRREIRALTTLLTPAT